MKSIKAFHSVEVKLQKVSVEQEGEGGRRKNGSHSGNQGGGEVEFSNELVDWNFPPMKKKTHFAKFLQIMQTEYTQNTMCNLTEK